MVRQVQPLRISKSNSSASSSTPSSSPNKMAASRPLAEITSTSQRRNSPSYNQATRKMIVSRENSPYIENENSSPFVPATHNSPLNLKRMSPFRFDSENTPERSPSPSVSPTRRTSIERLKQASRVKNSNIFALESRDAYDPASMPIVERPSANRPLSQQFSNNSFTRFDSMNKKENNPVRSPQRPNGHKRSETEIYIPTLSPSREAAGIALPISPEKDLRASPSPTKSAMRASMFGLPSQQSGFDPENGTWSDDERTGAGTPRPALHRQNKSVTFHADPPVVNEYVQQTPEPSVSVGSREGSWESDDVYDEQQDYSFERGSSADPPAYEEHEGDDSFDEDLENADKTPVVLPEDWRRMSPDEARTDLVNDEDDVFESPDASPQHQRPILGRSESVASDGSARPLPPLPAFMTEGKHRDSGSLAAAAERASVASRGLPSPPKRASVSKEEILRMTHPDRVPAPTSSASSQASGEHALPEELTVTNLDTGAKMEVQVRVAESGVEEDDSLVGDLSEFAAAPRISRESILRKVRNTKYDFEDESEGEESVLDSREDGARPTIEQLARMDPNEPIPSRENSRETSANYLSRLAASSDYGEQPTEEVQIKPEPIDDEEQVDLNAIPAYLPQLGNTAQEVHAEQLQRPRSHGRVDDYDRQSSVLHHRMSTESAQQADDDDDASHYSDMSPEAESTFLHHTQQESTLQTEISMPAHDDGKESLDDAMQLLSVRDYSERVISDAKEAASVKKAPRSSFMGLPSYLASGEYDFGMSAFGAPALAPAVAPSPPTSSDSTKKLDLAAAPVLQSTREMWRPAESVQQSYAAPTMEVSPPGTPDSVIQHRSSDVSSLYEDVEDEPVEQEIALPEPKPEVVIPERRATIKTGGKLKARPSVSRADLETMGQQRSIGSEEPAMPEMPHAYREDAEGETEVQDKPTPRRQSRKMLNLDIPQLSAGTDDLGLGLECEFDKVIESQKVHPPFPPPLFARFDVQKQHGTTLHNHNHASVDAEMPSPYVPHTSSTGTNVSKQKGYLMRQNTKVVVASNRNFSNNSNDTNSSVDGNATPRAAMPHQQRGTRSAGNSPRKPSAEQFLKTEPWNGKTRRKSVRQASAQKAAGSFERGPAPPLPGQESAALSSVDEDYATATGNLDDEVPEGTERGRLFVKVVGVKELDLPLPRNDRVYFQLTLDNGLHCVTTANLELGKQAPIGQEFELVVQEDLEFQLTLTTKLPPAPKVSAPTPTPSSPTKSVRSQKTGGFAARFLSSPKKRAERERQEREAHEAEERRQQEEFQRKRASMAQPTAWDQMRELVNANDGAFARSYVNLKAHEKDCFGRQLTVDVPCYNEWAQEKDTHVVNSVRSKRGGAYAGTVRRPPYVVGKLELQLVYVPKPKGAGEEAMPKSMGSALREMTKASEVGEVREVVHEGCLSQQGGDCQHWRRRFFRLQGPRLTAYHEHTHQKRAVVNLAKASRLVDDKSSLVANPPSSSPSKGRRKSAFAEEDEGYAYVEEGFRIRFANGETIDFYADSAAEKEEWMQVLAQVIGKPATAVKKQEEMRWTDLVLARERKSASESGSSSSPTKPSPNAMGGTEVQDFTRPAAPGRTQSSDRRPVPKSAPTSPMKGAAPRMQRPPPPPPAARARTPPMSQRSGHRSRDAVKSMIF